MSAEVHFTVEKGRMTLTRRVWVRWPHAYTAHQVRSSTMIERYQDELVHLMCGRQMWGRHIIAPPSGMAHCKTCERARS